MPEEEIYKPGDRVVLTRTTDPHTRLQPGAMGTVHFVDDLGTVHVIWDGQQLGLVPGVDVWRPLHPRWDPQYDQAHPDDEPPRCTRCGHPLVPGCCDTTDIQEALGVDS